MRSLWLSPLGILAYILMFTTGTAFGENLFHFGGKNYKETDLPISVRQRLADAASEHYRQKTVLFQEAALQLYFEQEASRRKKSARDIEEDLLSVGDPTEADLKKFYDENQQRIPFPFDSVKEELKTIVAGQMRADKRQNVLKQIEKSKGFRVMLDAPKPPKVAMKVASFPARGNANSKLHIVEFADYQCPHCKHASDALKEIWDAYKGKVKMTFVDFPINPSGISRRVSEGGYCAGKQEKFWEYHYMAFDNQRSLSQNSPKEFAKALKLDEGKFADCLDSKEAKEFVESGKVEGERVGVTGTPTFYFNGQRMAIGHDAQSLRQAIDSALKETST